MEYSNTWKYDPKYLGRYTLTGDRIYQKIHHYCTTLYSGKLVWHVCHKNRFNKIACAACNEPAPKKLVLICSLHG